MRRWRARRRRARATGRGVMVLTRRGGPKRRRGGFGGGSGALAGGFFPLAGTGASMNICAAGGSVMFRCLRARRSTNWRATTSSIVLDALFTSMP